MTRFPFATFLMLSRLTILIILLALLGAGCSRTTTTTTSPDSTSSTTSDQGASIVFGSGSLPETMPTEFPIPDEAVIGSTLIDRNRELTEMNLRVSADVEAITDFFTTNLPGRGFTVDSSGREGSGWKVGYSGAAGSGTIVIAALGQGVSQALVTFTAGS